MDSTSKNAGTVAAEILMERTTFRGAFLIVEGVDDKKFWSPRVTKSSCTIIEAGGKLNLIGAIDILNNKKVPGIIGVIDDDCDCLCGVKWGDNIISTDTRDLETLLVNTNALEKTLAELGDPAKIKLFESTHGSPKDALLARGVHLGKLRWYVKKTSLNADLKNINAFRFTDAATWTFNVSLMLDTISLQAGLPAAADLAAALDSLPATNPLLVCRGHDLVDLLAIGLDQILGNKNPGRDKIGNLLRAGYEDAELKSTRMYAEITAWETKTGYVIVKK